MNLRKKISSLFAFKAQLMVFINIALLATANIAIAQTSKFPLNIYSYNSKIPLGSIAEYRKDNVRYMGDEGDWVNIQIDGGIPAWMKKNDVSVSSNLTSASVIKPKARIYINSNLTSRYLITVNSGHQAPLIEDLGEWVQVTTPSSMDLKVKKTDYDRIYTRFGSSSVNTTNSLDNVSAPVVKRAVVSQPIVRPVAKKPMPSVYVRKPQTQYDIQSLPDATIETQVYNTSTPAVVDTYIPTAQTYPIEQQVSVAAPVTSQYINNGYQPSSVYATTGLRDYQLTPGDVVSISVFGEPEMLVKNVKIPVNGYVSFPLVGQVFVAGKTPSEVERSIEGSLAGGYLSDPKVNLSIDVYRPVYVRGEVYSPGSYDFNVGLTVAKLLTTAGGATKNAIKETVKLFRNNAVYLENLNVDSQELIHPGDIVSVEEKPEEVVIEEPEPETFYIYMHGEVKSPGEYEYRSGLTVEKAVALAGGFGPRASKKKISISREVAGQDEPEKFNKVKLYSDLQPGDIVYIGESWF